MSSLSSKSEISLKPGEKISGNFGSYEIKRMVGEGVHGRVALCTDLSTEKDVIVKMSRLKMSRATQNEAFILHNLRSLSKNKNVVEFIGFFHYHNHYCLVLECLDISLHHFMQNRKFKPLHISHISYITKQLLVTFKELSKRGLVHTDLKPDNIMLVDQEHQPFKIKLIDFGLARKVSSLVPGRAIQALLYRAPEVVLGTKVNEAADMWSLGCVMAFLYLGQHLFLACNTYELMRRITLMLGNPDNQQLKEGLYTDHFFVKGWSKMCTLKEYELKTGKPVRTSQKRFRTYTCLEDMMLYHPDPVLEAENETIQFLCLMKQIMQINPEKRITPAEALKHPFITHKVAPKMSRFKRIKSYICPASPKEDGDTSSDLSSSESKTGTAWTGSSKTKMFIKGLLTRKTKVTRRDRVGVFKSSSEDERTRATKSQWFVANEQNISRAQGSNNKKEEYPETAVNTNTSNATGKMKKKPLIERIYKFFKNVFCSLSGSSTTSTTLQKTSAEN